MYIIDLNQWGITQGIPAKPYKSADFVMADTNIQGINNAIQYAAKNGYTSIQLPRGQYALCYPRTINLVSNMTFDLNGSTLKVIYDSDKKSPFDTRTTADYYNFGGNSILLSNVTNAHVIGGTLIGCRDDRSFVNAAEASMESTYGVVFSKGSSYCSVTNCFLRDYMGDNVSFISDVVGGLAEFNAGLSLNGLDYTTGQPTPSNNTVITKMLDLPANLTYSSIMVTGAGYSRVTNLVSKDFDIFYYGSNNNFIGVLKKRKIYTDLSVPKGATKFRLLFYNETNTSKILQIIIRWGSIPHHNLVEHNEIFNGHRGGITLGGSYNVIQHNVIRDNGKSALTFLDGKPSFPPSTRYSINQEDSYGDNCVIRNNLIYGSFHGILVGCYSIQIENNHIYNIESFAINLYTLLHATIRGNFIYNCLNNIGFMGTDLDNAYVNITGNSFYSGTTYYTTNSYKVIFAENNFVNPYYLVTSESTTFKNNNIKFISSQSGVNFQINKIEGCTFDATSLVEITFKSYAYIGCSFNNIKANLKSPNSQTIVEDVLINNCDFKNSVIKNYVYLDKAHIVTMTDSRLVDTTVAQGITNTDNQHPIVFLRNCKININSIPALFTSESNRPYTTYQADSCSIQITNPNFTYLLKSGTGNAVNQLIIKKCNIEYNGVATLRLTYYSNKANMINFISVDNTFKNIILPAEDSGIYLGYDPNKKYKQTVTLQPSGNIYTTTVMHNLNTVDPYIQCLSTNSQIIQPPITINDSNSIVISYTSALTINVTVIKI